MSDDELSKRMRRAAREGKIGPAVTDAIEMFGPFAHQFVLRVFGVRGAWLSDETDLLCMTELVGTREERLEMAWRRIERVYGVDVRPMTNLVQVLRKVALEGKTGREH